MKLKSKNINRGAAIISTLFALLFFVLFIRFTLIQATGKVDGQVLAALAEKTYTKKQNIEAIRGTIYDRNELTIAEDTASYTVVAILNEELTTDEEDPQHVVDHEYTAQKLAPLLNMDEAEVLAILKKDKDQVEFGSAGRDINYTLKEKIEALKLPGIAFRRDLKRYYPNGTFASDIIGYAQKETNEKGASLNIGRLGLEKSLNNYLTEKDGYITFQSDTAGFKLLNAKEQIVSPNNGDNVYLTIDQKIQTFLEDAMTNVAKEWEPEKMIAIVANPKTGEILAMSQRPSFDPNIRNITNFYNDAISYRYEPGSTMKIYTLAAAIEEGVYNGAETYESGVYTKVSGAPIRDHNNIGWGTITFDEGVRRSSNVGFAILGKEKLGVERLLKYLDRFGLNRPTNIDLEGEVSSVINFKWDRDQVSTAFGQGSAITPIQQIQAASAIANDGKMMQPYVIDKIVDPDTGKAVLDHEPVVAGEPISKETSEKVLDILETVVSAPTGTAKLFKLDGYEVAGKTGTAQIADPKGGYLSAGEGHQNYIFSFIGMVPKNDPQLVMYIAVQKPNKNVYQSGSEPVAAIFKPVITNSLQYLQIQPTEKVKIEQADALTQRKNQGITVDSYIGQNVEAVRKTVETSQVNALVIGEGEKIIGQIPAAGNHINEHEKILLLTDGNIIMPNVIGWSLRDVMKLATLTELMPTTTGNGYVISQSVAAGTSVKKNDKIEFMLQTPDSIE